VKIIVYNLLNPGLINIPINLQVQLLEEIVTRTHKFWYKVYIRAQKKLLGTDQQ